MNTVIPGTILTPAITQTFTAWVQQLVGGNDWDEIERRFIHNNSADHFGQPEAITLV